MEILTDQQLLDRIDAFLARTDMRPTRFGRDAVGEASLIDSLRKGRSLSLRLACKVADFMAAHESDHMVDDGGAVDRNEADRSTADTSAAA